MHVGLSPSLHCSALLFSSRTPCPRRLRCRPGHHPSSIHIPESSILPADQISPKLMLFPRMERNAGIGPASLLPAAHRRPVWVKGSGVGRSPREVFVGPPWQRSIPLGTGALHFPLSVHLSLKNEQALVYPGASGT